MSTPNAAMIPNITLARRARRSDSVTDISLHNDNSSLSGFSPSAGNSLGIANFRRSEGTIKIKWGCRKSGLDLSTFPISMRLPRQVPHTLTEHPSFLTTSGVCLIRIMTSVSIGHGRFIIGKACCRRDRIYTQWCSRDQDYACLDKNAQFRNSFENTSVIFCTTKLYTFEIQP
jgi:hypothetical protein